MRILMEYSKYPLINTCPDINNHVDIIINATKNNYVNLRGGGNSRHVIDCIHAFIRHNGIWDSNDRVDHHRIDASKRPNPNRFNDISVVLIFYNKARMAMLAAKKESQNQAVYHHAPQLPPPVAHPKVAEKEQDMYNHDDLEEVIGILSSESEKLTPTPKKPVNKKKIKKELSDSSEKKPTKKKSPPKKVVSDSDASEDESSSSEEEPPKKLPKKKAPVKSKKVSPKVSDSDTDSYSSGSDLDSDSDSSEEPPQKPAKKVTKKKAPPKKKAPAKKAGSKTLNKKPINKRK